MTETELAIEHFSYGISHDIYSEPVTTYAKLAVEALKEKQERDKGCEYCNNESHIRNKVDTLEFADGTIRDDKGLTVSIATTVKNNKPMVFVDICNYENDLQFGFAANFCPVCGKRLEEHHESD